MPLSFIQRFLRREAAGGVVLAVAALFAVGIANSPLAAAYHRALALPLGLTVQDWINDGLMAVFFLVVSLEIKREIRAGELSNLQKAALPAIAALGGMVVPAVLFGLINLHSPATRTGWAIPTATDIAFAAAVLAALGRRIPPSLKVFLLALAIIDDLGALVIIAVFYSGTAEPLTIALSLVAILTLVSMNRLGITRMAPYLAVGVLLWLSMLESGVHATLAGVITGAAIPMTASETAERSALGRLEHTLHPWVTYLILPLFALANAGIDLGGASGALLLSPLPLGIMVGLVAGKPLGVLLSCWTAIRLRLGRLPDGTTWRHLAGLSMLCGIGFTMSLFIGHLAFAMPGDMAAIRAGVMGGSLLSAVLGALWLIRATRPKPERAPSA